MRTTSLKLDTANLTANEEALRRCRMALEFKDKGDYDNAQEVMRPLWKRIGERPEVKGLHASVVAEVLLCAGVLSRWIGSKNPVEEAQELGRDLISESIAFYESIGDVQKITAARVELAWCYWQEGALDEARIMLNEALQRLTTEGNTRARALLRLAIVEWSASRYSDSLKILLDNATLFKKITNHSITGNYHNQLAIVLTNLAEFEKRDDYFQWAIKEHEEADYHFKLAQNTLFRAEVKNNLGFLLFKLSRFKEAHRYLDEARRLSVIVRDKVATAQIDETRAQVLIAQGKLKEAQVIARSAVSVLAKSGHQCLLADALVTHGIALARLHKTEQAQFIFQRAIEVAYQVGALNKAGLAALTMIEEIDDLSPDTLSSAHDRAGAWLSNCQSRNLWLRFTKAGKKLASTFRGKVKAEEATAILFNKPQDLEQELLETERARISQALAQANGSVTHAARRLGFSYQRLAYMIASRHPDLLKERSPVHRRSRKD